MKPGHGDAGARRSSSSSSPRCSATRPAARRCGPATASSAPTSPWARRAATCGAEDERAHRSPSRLAEALEIFAQPKQFRGRGAPKPPLGTFGEDPISGKEIVLKEGKFGLYVTDGETNASLRRGDDPADLTPERASELLAAAARVHRLARGAGEGQAARRPQGAARRPQRQGPRQGGQGAEGPGRRRRAGAQGEAEGSGQGRRGAQGPRQAEGRRAEEAARRQGRRASLGAARARRRGDGRSASRRPLSEGGGSGRARAPPRRAPRSPRGGR